MITTKAERDETIAYRHGADSDCRDNSGGLVWTLGCAVSITTIIVAASFVLSFATLRDLAAMAGLPRELTWLWPVIVDGTILQATISVIAVSRTDSDRGSRLFFWIVLVTSALVSIVANGMHAFLAGTGTLHPALAAAIATVAPISLLASTHGISELLRATTNRPSGDSETQVIMTRTERASASWDDIARTLVDAQVSTRLGFEDIVEIVRCSFEHGMSNRTIAKRIGSHHSTVGRLLDAARAATDTQTRD